MKQYLIKWRKEDTGKLRSSVVKFNNKIRRLQKLGITNLPDLVNYKDIKSDITTRTEFNRRITSLNSFLKSGAENKVNLGNGIEITKWERKELQKQRRIAIKNLNKELEGLQQTLGTGNARVNEIKSTLSSFDDWENTTYENYRRRINRIKYLGHSDLEMKQARIFQRNFIKAYRAMGRKEAVEYARSFKNPLEFWDAVKNSQLSDISLQYDVKEGIVGLNMDADDTYYYELFKLGINL